MKKISLKTPLVLLFCLMISLILQSYSGTSAQDETAQIEDVIHASPEVISYAEDFVPVFSSPQFNPGLTTLHSPSAQSITISGSGTYRFEAVNNSGIYVSLLGHSGNGSKTVSLPVTFTVSCNLSGTKDVTLFLFNSSNLVEDHAAVVSFQ